VSKVYPTTTAPFARQLMALLDPSLAAAAAAAAGDDASTAAGGSSSSGVVAAAAGGGGAARLDPALRRAAVAALILLRNRGQLDPLALLPLLFRLFAVPDKALREMLLRHIIAGGACRPGACLLCVYCVCVGGGGGCCVVLSAGGCWDAPASVCAEPGP
jgi:hypothetical protein